MITFSNQQLRSMLTLQDTLNAVVHPQWRDQNFAWHRAANQEASELMDHIGWKWWKKVEPNTGQARIEVVDIWHFALSFVLQQRGTNIDSCVESILNDITLASHQVDRMTTQFLQHNNGDELEVTRLWIEIFQSQAAGDKVVSPALTLAIGERLGMTADDFYVGYVAKNVLNIFRQENGYKEGVYIKIWDGQEDNVFLGALLADDPSVSPEELLLALRIKYQEVKEAQA